MVYIARGSHGAYFDPGFHPTDAWYDIADRMAREEDWQPIYWIVDWPSMPSDAT